jgi:hypothetical protein
MRSFISFALALAALCLATEAHAATTCNISGKERKLGATYVTSLSASGVGCARAETVVKAYHRCRHRHGAAGRCPRVLGYKCSEKREAIATQYDSHATCTHGSRRVVQVYTQNT